MENVTDLSLSPPERRTLQHLVEGELHTTELDWVALQRLKRLALAEERNGGWGITTEGRRHAQRLMGADEIVKDTTTRHRRAPGSELLRKSWPVTVITR